MDAGCRTTAGLNARNEVRQVAAPARADRMKSFLGKTPRNTFAEAGAGTSDNGNFVLQPHESLLFPNIREPSDAA